MIKKIIPIDCTKYSTETKRKTVFNIVEYTFNYKKDDKDLLDMLIDRGNKLAAKVNPGAANDGTKKRDFDKIVNNCVAGIISEYLWKQYLNDEGNEIRVDETPFENASFQIDLKVLKTNKTIEVRSSFPRNGIPFALCHPEREFDVIGPYKNDYKPGEIKKDFYVRTLFHLKNVGEIEGYGGKKYPKIEKIMEKVYQDDFKVHLTGGATWAMMTDDKIAIEKDFIPDDELSIDRSNSKSVYRVVPFSKSLDSLDVYELIKAE